MRNFDFDTLFDLIENFNKAKMEFEAEKKREAEKRLTNARTCSCKTCATFDENKFSEKLKKFVTNELKEYFPHSTVEISISVTENTDADADVDCSCRRQERVPAKHEHPDTNVDANTHYHTFDLSGGF